MKKSGKNEYETFDETFKTLLKVSHGEIKSILEKDKETRKRKKSKKSKKSSASRVANAPV